jgi:hypothetical protein
LRSRNVLAAILKRSGPSTGPRRPQRSNSRIAKSRRHAVSRLRPLRATRAILTTLSRCACANPCPSRRTRHAFAYVFEGSGTFSSASQPFGVLTEVAHAAGTTSRHACMADALKARCVLADVRWRWTSKVLYLTAWVERNPCADPTLLNPCILRSLVGLLVRILVAPSTTLMSSCDSKITSSGRIRSQILCDQLI